MATVDIFESLLKTWFGLELKEEPKKIRKKIFVFSINELSEYLYGNMLNNSIFYPTKTLVFHK